MGYHDLLHAIADAIGHHITADLPPWMHLVLHLVLIWAPLAFLLLALLHALSWTRRRLALRSPPAPPAPASVRGFEPGIYRFILRHSRTNQAGLIALGLIAMPLLYATLELPKLIVNGALASEEASIALGDLLLDQTEYLFLLCALYLVAILASGSVKYALNIWKGRVGERLLRRLRLYVYRAWKSGAGPERRGEIIPLVVQEVEPIGGFGSDAFALPIFQGGTFVTILIFMFVQDPILGAAAVALLPVQLAVLPRLQRRVNGLARARAAEVRVLGGELSDQSASTVRAGGLRNIGRSMKRIEEVRFRIHREKFFMKSLSNFLSALTPFFFYSIGGYLVIQGRLSLGALVAVLAAYKDFSAPLRELFRYYQAGEDARVRYAEVLRFLHGTPRGASSEKTEGLSLQSSARTKTPEGHPDGAAPGSGAAIAAGAVSALLLIALPGVAASDASTDVLSGVTVENAWTLPADAGSEMRLRFRLENTSGRTIVLEEVRSDFARDGVLRIEDGFFDRVTEQLVLPDQEVLELGSTHLMVTLTGLDRPIDAGEVIEFDLVFRSGTVTAQAHVHSLEDEP